MTAARILYTKWPSTNWTFHAASNGGRRERTTVGRVGWPRSGSWARCSRRRRPPGRSNSSRRRGEIGVTADTIRIAVIADVDNAARPGLFQGSVDGVNAFAKFVNANGGLAGGRKLQVDFIDSKLSADEARNALVQGVPGGLRHRRHDCAVHEQHRADDELRRPGRPGDGVARRARAANGDRAPVLADLVPGDRRRARLRDEGRGPEEGHDPNRRGQVLHEAQQGPARRLHARRRPQVDGQRRAPAGRELQVARRQVRRRVQGVRAVAAGGVHADRAGDQAEQQHVRAEQRRLQGRRVPPARRRRSRASTPSRSGTAPCSATTGA